MLLRDRVAIITGGASGMGRATTLRFAEEGCSVVIADINEAEGAKIIEEVTKKGGSGIFVKCDVTNSSQVQDMVTKTISKFGKIDILVNDAGGIMGRPSGKIEEVTEEWWHKILDLNLTSQFLCSKAVVPYMKEKRYGKIVNFSSIGATHPVASVTHYHAAKGGVLGLTHNMAVELASFNICVNAILPGPIPTPFWEPLTKGIPDKEAFYAELGKRSVPLGRVGKPEEVAAVALFFASELSSYVTGQSLYVSGGQPLPVVS
jgi:NAD(P)-dependent dehydrogenase (short-subunit alcohol dehydrogenase family)